MQFPPFMSIIQHVTQTSRYESRKKTFEEKKSVESQFYDIFLNCRSFKNWYYPSYRVFQYWHPESGKLEQTSFVRFGNYVKKRRVSIFFIPAFLSLSCTMPTNSSSLLFHLFQYFLLVFLSLSLSLRFVTFKVYFYLFRKRRGSLLCWRVVDKWVSWAVMSTVSQWSLKYFHLFILSSSFARHLVNIKTKLWKIGKY